MNSEYIIVQDGEQRRKMIDENFCFHCSYPSISGTQNAYAYYKDHKKQQKELYKSSIPIAIDTNVLLELYSISFKERNQFLKFINENAHRIIISSQVQHEYMNHRTNAIQSFVKTLKDVEGFPKKVHDGLKQAFDVALSQLRTNGNRPIVSNDMDGVPDIIQEVREFIEQNKFEDTFLTELEQKFTPLIESVRKGVEGSLSKAVYELDDPVLAALSKTTVLSGLTAEEEAFLREKYGLLLSMFNEQKNGQAKDLYTFPGCGDRKKIKDGRDPLGDFFIYHELLSYMWHQNKDIVFLTNDVTKSDWIMPDGKPFNHYIVDTYINTGHMLYILNARDFTTLSFEAVAEVSTEENDDAIEDANPAEGAGQAALTPETTGGDSMGAETSEHTNVANSADVNGVTSPVTIETPEGEDNRETIEERNGLSYLRDVTKERFLQELETAELWASSYGDGYVSKDYFVFNILGHKRFHYHTSIEVLDDLVDEGVIAIVDEERDGRNIKCLKKIHN